MVTALGSIRLRLHNCTIRYASVSNHKYPSSAVTEWLPNGAWFGSRTGLELVSWFSFIDTPKDCVSMFYLPRLSGQDLNQETSSGPVTSREAGDFGLL